MKIRWILGCFCAVVSVLTSASDKAKQEVVMYTESQYRPYSYIEDGQLKGIYIDLIARMNQELPEYKITTYAMPWFEALNNVKKAKGDAILGTYFLGKSRPQIYPYSMPIYKEEIILVCSDKTIPKGDYNFPQDFQGKVIANVKGYEAWRRDAVKNISYESYFRFFEVPSTDIALAMVVKDNIDCALFESLAFQSSFQHLKQVGKYVLDADLTPVVVHTMSVEDVYVGFSWRAFHDPEKVYLNDFKRKFDNLLHDLQKSGELQKIVNQYVE